ncbi:MAG: bifunctional nicotinamide-nucleotide adenylyltransferase/Nudix hydroxylase [Rhizobacter sp.]|nr:bifunctional nicotinamide-nucleotide adenylyltransferase/Nudix hydroxylase [Rhizobacter sp.]
MPASDCANELAVYVGRFQPFHRGHLALLRRALALAPLCVVVIGSAFQARTPKNPFTWTERADMIRAALSPDERNRLRLLPVRDHYDLPRWVAAVRRGVADLMTADGLAAEGKVVLVGHFKDPSSDYLRSFPGWAVDSVDRIDVPDGAGLRDALFADGKAALAAAPASIAAHLPPTTLAYLREWLGSPEFQRLANEWRMLNEYHAAWASAPYPPVLVTVDAVVRCAGQVLLIRRAHAPGVGLYAVPGGFIEQRETALQSCLRELQEETHLAVPEEELRQCLKGSAVFDHPDRSLRGRTITHAFFFDLGERQPPAVQADDDAQSVEWLNLDAVRAAEDQFHDDHFHMLDHFLGLIED